MNGRKHPPLYKKDTKQNQNSPMETTHKKDLSFTDSHKKVLVGANLFIKLFPGNNELPSRKSFSIYFPFLAPQENFSLYNSKQKATFKIEIFILSFLCPGS